MAASRQIRLLLWKDYLIRKRNPITLAGVLWATAVVFSLYIVRINVENQDIPTCQFPARALPSAGVMTFLQSFICSVNNECSPMDEFEEIPSYKNAKLTKLKNQLLPLFSNSSLLDTAGSVPHALQLLATLSDVADVPEFVYIAKNGLHVKELFRNPERVKRYIAKELDVAEPVANSLLDSELSFEGLLQGNLDRCNPDSVFKSFKITNTEDLDMLVKKICPLSSIDIQKLLMNVVLELDLGKYVQMLGNMYYKLSKDDRLTDLGKMTGAALRMISIQSFLPPEITEILYGETPEFSYVQLDVISNILDYFEPSFGDTQSYKSIKDYANAGVVVVEYLNRLLEKQRKQSLGETVNPTSNDNNKLNLKATVNSVSNVFSNAIEAFNDFADDKSSVNAFDIMSQILNFIYKWLPDKTKHDVLFYSTLITKLIEGAERVIYINVHLEKLMYNVSLRHPRGIDTLMSLPLHIFEKGLDALADPERAQLLTSKLDSPGEMFCDDKKLQKFFEIDNDDAVRLRGRLCSAAWQGYLTDMIRSFGIYEVRNNINTMASLFIQETLGKDTASQLYSLDHDFAILKNFSRFVNAIEEAEPDSVNWKDVFDVNKNSDIMTMVRNKKHAGNQMLVTLHGVLAKAVVKQNPILEYKISPFLIDATTVIEALNKEVKETPQEVAEEAKKLYPAMLRTILTTALIEDKTYKLLSTFSQDALCAGVGNASEYLNFPPGVDRQAVTSTLCSLTAVFEKILTHDSHLGKAIANITSEGPQMTGIQWTKLITDLKNLYANMSQYYPYLFEYKSYGMEERTRREVAVMIKGVKSFWFSPRNWSRGIRMSIKLAFAVLDLVDREIFDVKSDAWLQIKYNFDLMTGPLLVIDDVVKTVGAITKNETFKSLLPANTVLSLSNIIPNLAQMLKDATDLIISDDTRIEPIIEVMNANKSWPCSTSSLADLLTLSDSSKDAVRAAERLLCLPRAEQEEWNEYLESKNIYKHKRDDGNITRVGTHLFLRFSAAFDGFIEDTSILKDILLDALDESPDRLTLATAWRYAVAAFNVTERDHILRNLFAKIDTVVNSIRMPVKGGVPLISLWRNFVNCNSGPLLEEGCREVGRATWLNILKFLSLTMSNVADDLLTYFQEINEPDSNLLQLMGFTKKTGLYMLYDKLPDFIGVLANSYGDYGFMTQIRRAAHSSFWDCEAVVKSLTPAPGSPIDETIIARIQPFVCPSFLHWISLPRGDNAILDVVAKPQYYFFTSLVDELNSTFENAFIKGNGLSKFITELSNNKNKTPENFNLETVREKLTRAVDIMLSYKTNGSNPSYRMFNEANNKLVISTAYLTRIVTIINKILNNIENLNLNDTVPNVSENEIKKIQDDVSAFKRIFKRRSADGVAVVFDAVTNNLWQKEEHSLLKAFEATCSRLINNVTSKVILSENNKIAAQICAMNNNSVMSIFGVELKDDLDKARLSLVHFVKILKNNDEDNVGEISKFLKDRKQVISYLKSSIQYAYDLGIPVYLKYLHNNLQHHDVIVTVLSGGDWWQNMRDLYNGPYATNFFKSIEKIFEIAEDIFNNLDQVHWVRLMRDINSNSKEGFCALNTPLSEYIPDATGALSHLKQQICTENITEVFKELMPLRFASQIYDKNFKISTDVDYTTLNSDITKIEFHLDNISNGPMSPQVPKWVTKDKLERFRASAIALLSTESLTKVSFGLLSNIVDAGTLLLNNSQCILCSQFTTWFKQLNLQLYKKQEYDNLLCHLHEMDLPDVYHTLKNDFHWDMAIKELLSTRNYTKFELNKSINEFLGQTKQHLVEDITAPTTKISQCLTQNVTRNAFGNVTLFAKVLAYTIKLVRAELPHLQEIDGIRDVQYLKGLQREVAHRLDVEVPLKKYLNKGYNLPKSLKELISKDYLVKAVENSRVNVRITREHRPADLLLDDEHTWEDLCECCDCNRVIAEVFKNLNTTLIDIDLQQIQEEEFWRFNFISNVLEHVEDLVGHVARLLGVVSKVDVEGVLHGRLVSVIDTTMQLLNDDTLSSIVYSIRGLMAELTPLIKSPDLETSLFDLSEGLLVVQDIKNSLLEHDFKVAVSELFSDPDKLEMDLSRLGINNTNFWSIAAPRIQAGHLHLKPIFVSKRDNFRISDFVCEMEDMAKVIVPGNLDVVTSEDVHGAVIEQFCDLEEATAKEVVPVLLRNLNFTFIVDKVKDWLLTELYTASELTAAEGEQVLESIPQMAALVPIMQHNIGSLSGLMDNEPLLDYFKNDFSFNNLFGGGGDFMADAGRMTCGKPFSTRINRYFKSIVEAKDLSSDADSEQLKVLPTEFCRTMYKQIVNINGGKIVWSLVKPLVMGKILYTPSTPAVERIIQRANETFAPMVKTINLVHAFAKAFYTVDTLTEHRDGLAALTNLITAPSMETLRISLIGDGEMPDFNIDDVFEKLADAKDLGGILQKGSKILECMNLNRFKPVTDEQHLSEEAARLMRVNEFSAGLVFLNNDTSAELPLNVSYKIRMDIENTPTTNRLRNFFWVPGPESNFLDNMRYFRGFIQMQDIIDKAIIDVSADSNSVERKEEDSDWAMYTQQMPYPCYRKDFFQTSLYESQSLIVAFFFSLLFTTSSVVRFIVSDKETGNTGLMAVMGVNLSYHTLSWFISSLVELLVTCACVAAVLCFGGVLPRTAPALIFILLFIYAFSVLCFCYMLSKMFKAASFAAVCCGLAYMISFMPFVLILSLEALLTSSLKFLVCVSMSSSLCYAFLYILRYEATGLGAQWVHLWSSPVGVDDMSIGLAAILIFVDGIIYILIGLLLERFYGYKALQKNVISSKSSGEKAGVSVVNVSKVYGSGTRAKLALDNVSVELHTGQITTLLGQNGAGKTTLIKIMTGMLKPTQGHVVMRGDQEGGPGLGVCPQRDVLVRELTAREHVQLYAQIKSGLQLSELQEQVESTLRVLSLGAVADEPVSSLSGGTRRRLCVALAFVAEPGLVVLDEPTAGVDPAARRDIWSMILKLRENRTILLSTHHLDEAELLSDQIVIMHKGQVHTTGSPIEIKRSLGSGYKLTVMYPERSRKLEGLDAVVEEENICVEEKTKILLATVRSVIKNANLMDVNGLEVEITLPYFDPDGVSNNYLQLCTLLETNQSELEFHNFNMDCCSLEQVFFNICQQAETTQQTIEIETPSKSASTSSLRNDRAPLVPREGPLVASAWDQFLALLYARYIHYSRNRSLLFMLLVLPSLFVIIAMAFSNIRPPPNNEFALRLHRKLYENTTEFLVKNPSEQDERVNAAFAQEVMDLLAHDQNARNWTVEDNPECNCLEIKQECNLSGTHSTKLPELMVFSDVKTLNDWLIASQELYIEKRYGGYSSTISNETSNLVVWYNNKGHHAMPSYLNAMSNAVLRARTGRRSATITTYTHPLKISKEPVNKDTVYQHVADAGITAMILIAYSLVSAGGSVYLVTARCSQEKRLQLLAGVKPALYWTTALVWDMTIILINLLITAVVLQMFHFPVFVTRNNLPAICVLIILYGYGCAGVVHVTEKLFSQPSLANMVLFCANTFVGIVGLAVLLILDIISESEITDNARWILHKVFMLSPQFVLGDGVLEIAKNTIQAEVLGLFGMDTYRDPLLGNLIVYHYVALAIMGTVLFLLNLAIEYDCFQVIFDKFPSEKIEALTESDPEVVGERRRVLASRAPLRLRTIGNINAGFVDTEDKCESIRSSAPVFGDVAQCVRLGKAYPVLGGRRIAVRDLTLGIPPGQCTALLGQNGAGKSTTFAMLTGQVRPTAGCIYLDGQRVGPRDLCQGLISYCPQSDAIDPLLTVRETLKFYCRLRGITDQDEVIKRTIEIFDLTKYRDVRSGKLSGGNKRKLCTAIAFMGRTPLVLLDEPTSGMDPGSRVCVSRGVRRACASGRGVLLTTHALEDARRLAARVALLQAGALRALAPLDDCLRRFGGGHAVWWRVRGGAVRGAWRRLRAAAPQAQLHALHQNALHFLLPARCQVDGKEVTTKLSDVFRLTAEMQSSCDIEDYTINQSSLDQMFLSFAGSSKSRGTELEEVDPSPPATPATPGAPAASAARPRRRTSEDTSAVTAL